MPLFRARSVGVRFGDTAILERINFEVSAGEFVALMGKNGAGKSTLLDLAAGLRTPTAGALELDGRPSEAWDARARARFVSHLPQIVRAELPFTSEQLVLMGRYPHAERWFESAADREAVARAMARCECERFAGRRVSTLSGGERQRVMLAACLAQEPRLLLLDEPGAFLDVEQQLHCFSLLRDEAANGTACVAVTHDLNVALTFCTRIIVLSGGTIAEDLPVASARDRSDWLALFSPRLRRTTTADGGTWVCYQ
jgi:iron complex transport system ATP-binding protein